MAEDKKTIFGLSTVEVLIIGGAAYVFRKPLMALITEVTGERSSGSMGGGVPPAPSRVGFDDQGNIALNGEFATIQDVPILKDMPDYRKIAIESVKSSTKIIDAATGTTLQQRLAAQPVIAEALADNFKRLGSSGLVFTGSQTGVFFQPPVISNEGNGSLKKPIIIGGKPALNLDLSKIVFAGPAKPVVGSLANSSAETQQNAKQINTVKAQATGAPAKSNAAIAAGIRADILKTQNKSLRAKR